MIKFPFFQSQELNLDWILAKLKEILKFMPLDGNVGDILQRKADGAAWETPSVLSMDIDGLTSTTPDSADELPLYDVSAQANRKVTVSDIRSGLVAPVTSVNSKTGAVVLDKTDIGLGNVANVAQYSASNPPPYPVTSVNGQTGAVIVSGGGAVDSVNGQTGTVVLSASDVGALADTYTPPVLSVNSKVGSVVLDKTDVGLSNVANVAQYSSSNPPPYPVTSVNGQTGDVTVSASPLLFGAVSNFTVTSYAGIGSVVDSSLHYRMSSDSKFIMIWGWVELNFNTTGDYTILQLSGPTISGYTDTISYANSTALYFTTSGNMDFLPSKSGGFGRTNNQLRLVVWYPSNTGTLRAMIPCQLFALDA